MSRENTANTNESDNVQTQNAHGEEQGRNDEFTLEVTAERSPTKRHYHSFFCGRCLIPNNAPKSVLIAGKVLGASTICVIVFTTLTIFSFAISKINDEDETEREPHEDEDDDDAWQAVKHLQAVALVLLTLSLITAIVARAIWMYNGHFIIERVKGFRERALANTTLPLNVQNEEFYVGLTKEGIVTITTFVDVIQTKTLDDVIPETTMVDIPHKESMGNIPFITTVVDNQPRPPKADTQTTAVMADDTPRATMADDTPRATMAADMPHSLKMSDISQEATMTEIPQTASRDMSQTTKQ